MKKPSDDPHDLDDRFCQIPVQLPLSCGRWLRVTGPFPIPSSSWDDMLRLLEAMKPGLTWDDQGIVEHKKAKGKKQAAEETK